MRENRTCDSCGLGDHPGLGCAALVAYLNFFPHKVCEMAKLWPDPDAWAGFLETLAVYQDSVDAEWIEPLSEAESRMARVWRKRGVRDRGIAVP